VVLVLVLPVVPVAAAPVAAPVVGPGKELATVMKPHRSAVSVLAYAPDASMLVTASADMTMILWEAEGGQKLYQHSFDGPARYTEFSLGEREIMVTVDAFMGSDANIQVLTVSDDRNECTRPEREFQPRGRAAGGVVTTSSCVGLSTWEESWTSPAPVGMYRS
jgi:WD40 repeat protein